jgi:CBS domain-containing protein
MQAKELMTAPVLTITPMTAVRDIAALLRDRRISGLPVVEGERLIGIVCESDLLHRHEIGTDGRATPRPWWDRLVHGDPMPTWYVKSHGGHAKDIMTREVVSVTEDASLAEIASLLELQQIGRVPVQRNGTLVGIVTRADLVQAIAMAGENREVTDTQGDDAIRERLLIELERQPWWHSQWSTVFVVDGIVSFRGLVESEAEKHAARVAAENISGVRGVDDDRGRSVDWQAMM